MVYGLVEGGKAVRQLPVLLPDSSSLCSSELPNPMPFRICLVLFLSFIISSSQALLLSLSVHFVFRSGVDKSQQLLRASGCSHAMFWAQTSKTSVVPAGQTSRWTSKAWVAAQPLRIVTFRVKVLLFHSVQSGNCAVALKPVQSDPNPGVYLTFRSSQCICLW